MEENMSNLSFSPCDQFLPSSGQIRDKLRDPWSGSTEAQVNPDHCWLATHMSTLLLTRRPPHLSTTLEKVLWKFKATTTLPAACDAVLHTERLIGLMSTWSRRIVMQGRTCEVVWHTNRLTWFNVDLSFNSKPQTCHIKPELCWSHAAAA